MQKLVIYCDYETVTQSHKLSPIGRNVITQKQHPRNQTKQSKSQIPLCSIFTLFSTFPNKRFNPLSRPLSPHTQSSTVPTYLENLKSYYQGVVVENMVATLKCLVIFSNEIWYTIFSSNLPIFYLIFKPYNFRAVCASNRLLFKALVLRLSSQPVKTSISALKQFCPTLVKQGMIKLLLPVRSL